MAGRLLRSGRMNSRHARRALVAAALIVGGTLSVTGQQARVATVARSRAAARTTIVKAGASKLRADSVTTIQGNALNSTNGALNDAVVRLRDARFGRIVDTQLTDKSGLFAFKSVDPGTYIVEVINNNESVLAASELLNVNAGESVLAVVQLPMKLPLAGIIGSTDSTAAAIASQAAASSIVAIIPTAPISPNE
jgi:hypothetical protein